MGESFFCKFKQIEIKMSLFCRINKKIKKTSAFTLIGKHANTL